jgi:Na+-transporting methylmalonyl-CoA/oxaloacetate decarboxylase beta subunit
VSPQEILAGGWAIAAVFELGECLSSFAQPLEVQVLVLCVWAFRLSQMVGVIMGILLRNLSTRSRQR